MADVKFTDENFEEEVLKSELPVLVDFYADWCGPCRMMAPVIDEVANEYEGKWKIGKCNVDESPTMAAKFGVQSIPTLLFFKGGQVTNMALGFQSKEALKQRLDG
ncbi:MAG: thioredoxin [Candidatus Gracilibacteria bacterium]|nr:thioredoxin [Candidatus Gracilibacteria bacterium]